MRVCTCLRFCCSDWLYFEREIKTFYLQLKDSIIHSKEKNCLPELSRILWKEIIRNEKKRKKKIFIMECKKVYHKQKMKDRQNKTNK